ncbi:AAA family ATPase [Mucilaginibacter sp. RT5R15]|nr:AAA family ATPase [Mucilaginibacter flavidus]
MIAQPGDIVIIENPESDLHPRAQSKIGELIARCANAGIQIIVETHSDHVLNGIRLATSYKPPLISHNEIKVFYFFKELESLSTTIEEILIEPNGKMPLKLLKVKGITGFFDQIDEDYKQLFVNQNVKN